MQDNLTHKQRQILEFIEDYVEGAQMSPSLREIGAHFGVSVGTAQDQVEALRRKGYLEREGLLARGIRVARRAGQIPILGRVHAGPLHLAIEDVDGYVACGEKKSAGQFALRVKGDSMIEAGIFEGDLLIVRSQPTAHDGDIVVALFDDETTVKRLRQNSGRAYLEPANPKYGPIHGNFSIVGKVTEVRRTL